MNLFDVRFFYFIIVSYFYFQFCATLVLTFFILFIGAILAIVFRSQVSFFASGYIGEENSWYLLSGIFRQFCIQIVQ